MRINKNTFQKKFTALKDFLGKLTGSKTRLLLAVIVVLAGTIYVQQAQAITGTVYPDGDIVRQWTPTPTGCTATTHYACIDEASHSTSDYVNTGTALQQVTEEYSMTSVASSNVSITNVAVIINANSVTCNGNAPNCDTLSVNIRIAGSLQTAQTYTPTATNSQQTLNFTTGTPWTSDSNLEVIVTRNPVGGGNAANADDDMLLTGLKADITYNNNASFSMSSYRVFENDDSATASDDFTKLSDPATLPTGLGRGTSFSPDGTYMSVAHAVSPFITIYKRSGDTFTKLADPATLPPSAGFPNGGFDTAFSPDGTYLSVAHGTSPFITIYKRSGDTFTKLADPATLPTGTGFGTTFSPDGTYMSVSHNTSPFITIYKRSGDTFTKLADPATLPTGNGQGTTFSPDGTYMSVGHNTSPFITIYKRSGDTFTKLADPATLPTGEGNGTSFSPDGTYLSVALTTSPFITIYKRSGDTFTKLADPATLPTGQADGATFSPDGSYLSVSHNTSPFITIYKRSGDTFTKLADPSTLPAGQGDATAFSPDGIYMSAAYLSSPFISIYKRSVEANIGTPVAASNSAASIAREVPFRLRLNLHVSNGQAEPGKNFKLQYATRSGTCDTGHSGELFSDVTSVSSIKYHNNSNLTDATAIGESEGSNDPIHGADSIVRQTYEELNDITVSNAIPVGADGLWDFSLTSTAGATLGSYCLRVVEAITGTPLSTPSVVPEIVLATPTVNQANYRWFANADAATPGAPLIAQDNAVSVSVETPVRLRQRLAVDSIGMALSSQDFKLQYAEKSGVCDTSFSGETYVDMATNGGTFVSTHSVSKIATLDGNTTNSRWISESGATQDGDIEAGLDITFVGQSDTIRVVGDPPTIPAGATVTGFRVAHDSNMSGDVSLWGTLVMNGNQVGSRKLLTPSNNSAVYYTGSASDMWGTTLSASDINSATSFGYEIDAEVFDEFSFMNVDHMFVEIHYSLPPADLGYFNNPTPASSTIITSSGSDPTNGARPTIYQSYLETDPYTNSVVAIPSGSDGIWDFSLTSQPTAVGKTYCIRTVEGDGSPLDVYSQIPEITITTAGLTLQQQTRGGGGVLNGVKSKLNW